MNIIITIPYGDLQRETWEFGINYSRFECKLQDFKFQTRDSLRRRLWRTQTQYNRLLTSESNITRPEVPGSVLRLLREKIIAVVNDIKEVE